MEGSQSEMKEEKEEEEEKKKKKKKNEVINNNTLKGKSCKGCLYYSSIRKSNSQNPVCLGFTRTLQQVPDYIVGESEMEASKDGRNLTDFKYACLGYSVHLDKKSSSADPKEKQAELPVCVGIEFLVDKQPVTADHVPAHNKEVFEVCLNLTIWLLYTPVSTLHKWSNSKDWITLSSPPSNKFYFYKKNNRKFVLQDGTQEVMYSVKQAIGTFL
ncbi:hypothetical protein AQUCO_00700345v1 [Aquilegia coerulea]|uniref:DUF8204 domain-containing protein n=1 Tax=Aquilegia coerulea TaxID=218851 RepID=A0A2G5EJM7_AQUCA|nr:hypothetical protein AQUCO_00700345v1 [Aquilegia coerulea]PIA55966.1 hypothetical protein AQUCO_00700345v1 [Aquilegia coerulea]